MGSDEKYDGGEVPISPATSHSIQHGDVEKVQIREKSIANDDVDEALVFLGTGERMVFTEEQHRKLLWKIDIHMLPVLCLLYSLQFLDKTSISYASVMNIIPDTHLVGTQYNWLGSAFYIGYLAAEYPVNLALQRFPISKFLSTQILCWGSVLMIHAACSNFKGLITVRIILGIFEASVTPCFIMIVSQWWRKEEHGLRTGIWFCFNGMGQIVGAAVSYAIAVGIRKNHYTDLAGWQLIFIFTGGLTILYAIAFFFLVPDSPANAWFLSHDEKVQALERIRSNQQGVGNKHFKRYQVIAALKDPFTWLCFIFAVTLQIPNGALTNFKNIILQGKSFTSISISCSVRHWFSPSSAHTHSIPGFGLSKEMSLLYGAPSGAVQIISTISINYLADRTKNRLYWAAVSLMLGIVGFLLMIRLPQHNLAGNLAAFYLTSASSASFTLILSMIASNVAGNTKKSFVNAINLIGYCVGNLIGPQIIHLEDAPRYLTAKIIICVLYSFGVLILFIMRFVALGRNKRKEAKIAALGSAYQPLPNQEFLDLTDNENLEFRYVL